MIGALSLLAYSIGRVFFDPVSLVPTIGRTMAFAVLSLSQVVHTFNMRSHHSVFQIGLFSNPRLILAAIVCILLQVGVIAIPWAAEIFRTVPLTPLQWMITVVLSLVPLFCVEIEKSIFSKN